MQKRKESLLAFVLSFALLWGILPHGAAMADTAYNVWVENIQVTDANANDVLEDGGSVTYDANQNKLILTNAQLTTKKLPDNILPAGWNKEAAAIYAKDGVDIDLHGDNSITHDENISMFVRERHIFVYNNSLKINGDGNLTIERINEFDGVDANGIYSQKGINVGGKVQIDVDINGYNLSGFFSEGPITITDQAKVNIKTAGSGSDALYSRDGPVTIAKKANIVLQGSSSAMSVGWTTAASVDMSTYEEPHTVMVGKKFDGSDKLPWDGNESLHSKSPFKYIAFSYMTAHNVTFDQNYDGAPEAEKISINTENKLSQKPTTPKREGYQFLGWNSKEDGTGIAFNPEATFTDDATFYAQWQKMVHVTFYKNDGSADNGEQIAVDAANHLSSLPKTPSRDGYIFTGWNTKADGSGDDQTTDDTFTEDTALYAQWEKVVAVTFDQNYADAPNPKVIEVNAENKLAEQPQTPVRDGYVFKGWNTKADGSGDPVSTEGLFKEDTILYAVWEKVKAPSSGGSSGGSGFLPLPVMEKFDIVFDYNYDHAPAAINRSTNVLGMVSDLPAPERAGYSFAGWNTKADGSGDKISDKTVFSADTTLYAQWQAEADVPKANIYKVVMTIHSHRYTADEAQKNMDSVPVIKQSRTFVPYRALAEAFGAEVSWDHATKTVTYELGGDKVVMTIGQTKYMVNGVEKDMDVAPYINQENRTMIPVRFSTEALGYTVDYEKKDGVAKVTFTRKVE